EANGIRRFIFESLALAYPDRGDEWIDESTALSPITPWVRTAIEAEAMLNEFGRGGGEPVNLRFPRTYGPGRASGTLIDSVRRRQMPIIGSGTNFVSSIHTDDVGTAVAAALSVAPGTYNVSDDEPLPQREYLQHAADALGAPAPRRMAYPVARMVLGKLAVMASVSQRVSSAHFREAAGWEPRFRSAAEGWPDVVRRQEQALTAVAR